MSQDIKIFEGKTLKEALKKLFKAGYRPATIQEVSRLKAEGVIPKQWYDTSTLWYQHRFQKITEKMVDNLEEIYENRGKLLFLGNDGDLSLLGGYDLVNDGRFVGVKEK